MVQIHGRCFRSVDDVDVFVGLVSETHVAGSLVGPTLACLLGSQFEDIKFGDRFFYETRTQEEGFTDGSSSVSSSPINFSRKQIVLPIMKKMSTFSVDWQSK